MNTVSDLLAQLTHHPDVVGLVSYGTNHHADGYTLGDLDLFVTLKNQPSVESLHFDVGQTPVDLNLLALETLANLEPIFDFPQVPLSDSQLMYDPTGQVSRALDSCLALIRSRA